MDDLIFALQRLYRAFLKQGEKNRECFDALDHANKILSHYPKERLEANETLELLGDSKT